MSLFYEVATCRNPMWASESTSMAALFEAAPLCGAKFSPSAHRNCNRNQIGIDYRWAESLKFANTANGKRLSHRERLWNGELRNGRLCEGGRHNNSQISNLQGTEIVAWGENFLSYRGAPYKIKLTQYRYTTIMRFPKHEDEEYWYSSLSHRRHRTRSRIITKYIYTGESPNSWTYSYFHTRTVTTFITHRINLYHTQPCSLILLGLGNRVFRAQSEHTHQDLADRGGEQHISHNNTA